MKEEQKQWRDFLLLLIGGSVPTVIILGSVFNVPQRFVVVYVMFSLLIFGAMALWSHANVNADGTEWWQDDDATGWRGY